jgi:uncharacterized cupin superfamily protein
VVKHIKSFGSRSIFFQATRGDVLIDFPFTEHATVIEGAVTLMDETGQSANLGPGDSYLMKQDSMIFWHVAP